ncbi:MAG: biotin-dependent carboxyltransferase family protein [Chthoniobacterales bacterium]
MSVIVSRAGFVTTVQDLGRTGSRASGVSLGGALDPHALRVANLLVGNEPGAAGLELTMGTVRLQFEDDRVIAWCGGSFDVQIDERAVGGGRAAVVRSGEEILVTAKTGRAWLAVSGGLDVPVVLGSRSTDLRSGFGGLEGRALRDGDRLDVGALSARSNSLLVQLEKTGVSSIFAPNEWSNPARGHPFLRIVSGADSDRFHESTLETLVVTPFMVTPDSDRMGVRLEGPELRRSRESDLLSEAVAPGTIQVPPSGQPIILLGDCQTIGGYPKIAHVITVDLGAAAQLQAGDTVRFVEISLRDAQRLLRERERDLAMFRTGLELSMRWS